MGQRFDNDWPQVSIFMQNPATIETMTRKAGSPRPSLPHSPFNQSGKPSETPTYEHGDRVTHDRHGLGRVVEIEGTTCVVEFGADTLRRFPLSDKKLSKL